MRKSIEIAFAIALILISILATFIKLDIFGNTIYSVIIPAFLLSIISFIYELEEKCELNAKKFKELLHELSDTESSTAETRLKQYEEENIDKPYVNDFVPKEVYNIMENSCGHIKESLQYAKMEIFCAKFKKILEKLNIVAYILLFMSLFFSFYIAKALSTININCITLWSLTLLFFALELKNMCAGFGFLALTKIFVKKQKS